MLGVTKLLCGTVTPADALRYQRDPARLPAHLLQFGNQDRPVVVWNVTQRCNLRCVHCYAHARDEEFEGELSTAEAKAFIDDLAWMRAPTLLFSGGEPLVRPDLLELGHYAREKGLRAVISTNGTLITRDTAKDIKRAGFQYVGISFDGLEEVNDRFRARKGAFREALRGLHYCIEEGVRTGLRFTVSKRNVGDLEDILDFLRTEGIPRFCLYHLVYSGRGDTLIGEDLDHAETRAAIDLVFAKCREFHDAGRTVEMLTVDNHADNVYLYLKLREEEPERAPEVLELMEMQGGNGSGSKIGCVGPQGDVHPDQFWRHQVLGNVRERPFHEIWWDTEGNEFLAKLKNKPAHLKGRCGVCPHKHICTGFRARAEAVHGDPFAEDPACYLTDEELGIKVKVGPTDPPPAD